MNLAATPSASSVAEVLARLITGYEGLDARGRLEARMRHAAGVRFRITAQLVAAAVTPLTDSEREVLLAEPWEPPTFPIWIGAVPLVLFDVFYRPFAATARPRGNIRWLRPSREMPYLASLAQVGVLSVAGNLSSVGEFSAGHRR